MKPLARTLLESNHVMVAGDNPFQQRARLLQTRWRERQGYSVGEHRGEPLGSRLVMPQAQDELLNYLSPAIREVVRTEVDGTKSAKKLYGKPRIYNDLLSSQPLCFNLFGELQRDLKLATRALMPLAKLEDAQVTRIEFEHSPGRSDPRFTNDRSAFDVFVEYTRAGGAKTGFLGIEVKYHEALNDKAADHRERYDEIAQAIGCFKTSAWEALQKKPLQQIWRDHLLASSMLIGPAPLYDEGRFVFLYPELNERCRLAVAGYRECLSNSDTFGDWTLERVVSALQSAGAGDWANEFSSRYLAFEGVCGE